MSSVVYFAQEGQAGAVKIGWTRDIDERLINLAGPSLEAHIHQMLAEHRIRGEWFRPVQDVLDVIDKAARFGAAFFGAGYAEPDLQALFSSVREAGTRQDIERMREMSNDIADMSGAGHQVKARSAAVAR